MNGVEKIIYAAIAGFVVWLIQKIVGYFVIKSRITQGILSEIKLNLAQIKEAKNYLEKFEKNCLEVGHKLGYIDKFFKSNNSFYHTQIKALPGYYSRQVLDKLSKFFYSFWEMQILIEALMNYLDYLSKQNTALSPKDVNRAKKKLARIYKLAELLLENKINSLNDLIYNYEGRLGPDQMLNDFEC